MNRILRFNESIDENSFFALKSDINDILINFTDSDVPVEVKYSEAQVDEFSNTISKRQSIYINIGDISHNGKKKIKFSPEMIEDIQRLMDWSIGSNLRINKMRVNFLSGTPVDIDNINNIETIFNTKIIKREPFWLEIIFLNLGWQTQHKFRYGSEIKNQIIQQYEFNDITISTKFIYESTKAFEKFNHHPHYLNWNNTNVLISLKTHSTNGVTKLDWEMAGELDKIYKSLI
jgi:pterin-4a-carbinolamine dehydratase